MGRERYGNTLATRGSVWKNPVSSNFFLTSFTLNSSPRSFQIQSHYSLSSNARSRRRQQGKQQGPLQENQGFFGSTGRQLPKFDRAGSSSDRRRKPRHLSRKMRMAPVFEGQAWKVRFESKFASFLHTRLYSKMYFLLLVLYGMRFEHGCIIERRSIRWEEGR